MPSPLTRINFVQVAYTPHGDDFLIALRRLSRLQVTPWFPSSSYPTYGFADSNVSQDDSVKFYGNLVGALTFILRGVSRNSDGWFLAGWNNIPIKILIFTFFLTRKNFGIWVDVPLGHENHVDFRRSLLYFVLKRSRVTVFCIGQRALESLKVVGFKESVLVNMPITLAPRSAALSPLAQTNIRRRLDLPTGSFLIATGSRIVKDKGFDVLIKAASLLTQRELESIHIVIVGKGEFETELRELIQINRLNHCVTLIKWMEGPEFRELVSASNLVVHPSRVDSYGGLTLTALVEGVGVVGAFSAGSVAEIITDHWNGRIYDSEDFTGLANILSEVITNPEIARVWGQNMTTLAQDQMFDPEEMVRILLSRLGLK